MALRYINQIPDFNFGRTFQPIPIEFWQQQYDKRQNAYDRSEAMMLNAIDKYNQINVDIENIPDKEARLKSLQSGLDNIIQQRKGDLGAASSEIAKAIVGEGANEFWRLAPELKQRKDLVRQRISQLGADAFITDDDWEKKKVTYNPTTGKYDVPDLSGVVEQRIFHEPIMEKYFSSMKPSSYQDAQGYFQRGLYEKDIIEQANKSFDTYKNTSSYSQRFRELQKEGIADPESQIKKEFTQVGLERAFTDVREAPVKEIDPYEEELKRLKLDAARKKAAGYDSQNLVTPTVDIKGSYTLAGSQGVPDLQREAKVETDKLWGNIGHNLSTWGKALFKGKDTSKEVYRDLNKTYLEKPPTEQYTNLTNKALEWKGVTDTSNISTQQRNDIAKEYLTYFYTHGRNPEVIEYLSSDGVKDDAKIVKATNELFSSKDIKNKEWVDMNNIMKENLDYNEDILAKYPKDKYEYKVVGNITANNPRLEAGQFIQIEAKEGADEKTGTIVKEFMVGASTSERNENKFAHTIHSLNFNPYGQLDTTISHRGMAMELKFTKNYDKGYPTINGGVIYTDPQNKKKYTIFVEGMPTTTRAIKYITDAGRYIKANQIELLEQTYPGLTVIEE